MSNHTPQEYTSQLQKLTGLPCQATILRVGTREHLQGWLHEAQILHVRPVHLLEDLRNVLPSGLKADDPLLEDRLWVAHHLQSHQQVWSALLNNLPVLAEQMNTHWQIDAAALANLSAVELVSIANAAIARIILNFRPFLLQSVKVKLLEQ